MKKLDVRELIELRESLEAHELKERINKILRMFEEDEVFEVIDHGKVIAHVVPVNDPSALCAGLAVCGRRSVVVQPEFLIPQAGRRGNSVRPVRTRRPASSIPGPVVQH